MTQVSRSFLITWDMIFLRVSSGRLHSPASQPEITVLPIPDLPPAVTGYPTPWIDEQDHERYLVPLYTRGWGVSFKKPKVDKSMGGGKHSSVPDPPAKRHTGHLVAEYPFSNYNAAVAFVMSAVEVANRENVSNTPNPPCPNQASP